MYVVYRKKFPKKKLHFLPFLYASFIPGPKPGGRNSESVRDRASHLPTWHGWSWCTWGYCWWMMFMLILIIFFHQGNFPPFFMPPRHEWSWWCWGFWWWCECCIFFIISWIEKGYETILAVKMWWQLKKKCLILYKTVRPPIPDKHTFYFSTYRCLAFPDII